MDLEARYKNLPAQGRYGRLLGLLVNLGLVGLLGTFAVYVFGGLDPLVPTDQLSQVWNLSLKDFLSQTGAPIGWGWLGFLSRGDYLTFAAITFLATLSLIGYLTLLPTAWGERNHLLGVMVLAEILLIVLAASDVLNHLSH